MNDETASTASEKAASDSNAASNNAANSTAPEGAASDGMPPEGVAGDAATPSRPARHRRASLIVLAVLALIGGAIGSWTYNRGAPTREDRAAVIIRSAMDPSTYISPGDYNNVTVPIRNDGPYPITVVGLTLPSAPRLLWDGAWTVIQPGATASLRVITPFACPAIPHTLKHTTAVTVLLHVFTIDGGSHMGLPESISGVIQYAADYCALPTPTKRPA